MTIEPDLLASCKRLHASGMITAADGSISYRFSNSSIVITPSDNPKHELGVRDLARIDSENTIISGDPSLDRELHLAIYKSCRRAMAVIHAHPATAIAYTIANPEQRFLSMESTAEGIFALGAVPIVPYALPTSESAAQLLREFLPKHRVLILARQGVIAWGEDLQEAEQGIERVEHIAKVLLAAKQFGGITNLPASELDELRALRKELGDRTR